MSAPEAARRTQRFALVVGVAGLAACALGVVVARERAFEAYLFAYVFWIGVALGALAISMIHTVTGGAWGRAVRRPLRAAAQTLPLLAALFVPLGLGAAYVWPWARPGAAESDPILREKSAYLNVPFFLLRAAIYFAVWITFQHLHERRVREREARGTARADRRARRIGAPGLLAYGLTMTLASVDWIMSLDPHWYSSIFGVLVMGGQLLSGMAFGITVLVLTARPSSSELPTEALHDLGRLLLVFVMLWAYFSYSQYLIIYSGNIAEEIPWYIARQRGGWWYLAVVLALFHFVVPFLVLLGRGAKRSAPALATVAAVLLIMRLVDVYWLTAPSFDHGRFGPHWLDLAALAGVGGLWVAFFVRRGGAEPWAPAAGAV